MLACLTVADGGRVTVSDSRLVGADGSSVPFPCDGMSGACRGVHDGAVVVDRPVVIEMAAPLVCDTSLGAAADCHWTASSAVGPAPIPEPFIDHCPQALFDSKVAQMATTCCDDGGCNTLPSSCSDECRSFYSLFYQACWPTRMQQHPTQTAGFSGLHDLCGHTTVEPTAEPASACPPALFATSITQMGLKCCPTDVDCDPPPTVCSAECAAFYVPFYEACSSTEMAAVGASGMADFTSIYDLCIARGH